MKWQYFAAFISLLFLAGLVNASYLDKSLYIKWGQANSYFEIWNGYSFEYSANPYYYYGNNYYYYPSDYRYYYAGSWSYYPSGWYYNNGITSYQDPYWQYYDDYWYNSKYSYYYSPSYTIAYQEAPNYVIYETTKYPYYSYSSPYYDYYRSSLYGQRYIDPYYGYNYSYYPSSYSYSNYYSEPYLSRLNAFDTGKQVYGTVVSVKEPLQESCSSIDIATRTIFAKEGETAKEEFKISNTGKEVFYITNLRSSNPNIKVSGFDSAINSGSSGKLMLTIEALDAGNSSAEIEYSGYFKSGKKCSSQELGKESFQIAVAATTYQYLEEKSLAQKISQALQKEKAYFAEIPKCSQISAKTRDFVLEEGKAAAKEFEIENNTPIDFFVESVYVSENSNAFNAGVSDFIGKVPAFNSIKVEVKVNGVEEGEGKGEFKVSGYFATGEYCGFNSIGTEEFEVTVLKNPEEVPKCSEIQIIAPEKIETEGKVSWNLVVKNPLNETAMLFITAKNTQIQPETVAVGANETKNVMVEAFRLAEDKVFVFYDFESESCEKVSKISTIERLIPEQPIIQEKITEKGIEIDSNVSPEIDGSYDIEVVITNNSGKTVEGNIEINVPESWTVEGQTSLSLQEGESRKLNLKAKPNELNSEELEGEIFFASNGEIAARKNIKFAPNAGIMPTAFFALSNNAWVLGIIVFAVFAAGIFYFERRKRKEEASILAQKWKTE